MRRHSACSVAVLMVAAIVAACSRQAPDTPPVATPSATLNAGDAVIGGPIDVTYKFVVAADAPPFAEDYLVFVHFLARDRELLWTDDHQPATPTTAWKPGATIEYTRTTFVPRQPYTGDGTVEMGLYSAKSGARLTLAGTDTGMHSYRVADLKIGSADGSLVIFKDGWHDPEVAENAQGEEWQWSKRDGVLAFRNPKRDVTLLLQLDQPVSALPEPQRVEVKLDSMVVDTFPLPPGNRQVRRIPLRADQLGTADTTTVSISVDKTFIPAAVPKLKSGDRRELGLRLFRAFVQPK